MSRPQSSCQGYFLKIIAEKLFLNYYNISSDSLHFAQVSCSFIEIQGSYAVFKSSLELHQQFCREMASLNTVYFTAEYSSCSARQWSLIITPLLHRKGLARSHSSPSHEATTKSSIYWILMSFWLDNYKKGFAEHFFLWMKNSLYVRRW